jgi:hypothetical protein
MKNRTLNTYLTRLCLCALLAGVFSFSYGQQVDSIKVYEVTWCLTIDVPDPCPGYGNSEFGQGSKISCAVYHHHYEKKCDNKKQFTKLKEAKEFYKRALDEQSQVSFMRDGLSDVKLDSTWVKLDAVLNAR